MFTRLATFLTPDRAYAIALLVMAPLFVFAVAASVEWVR